LIRFTDLSLYWPEVTRFRERVATRYKPPTPADSVVILPCSKRKPYSLSRSHRLFSQALSKAKGRGRVEEIILTSPLGGVPRALEGVPPAKSYDIAVTGLWSEEEISMASKSLVSLLSHLTDSESQIFAHVTGGYERSCRRAEECLGRPFTYTGGQRATSPGSLEGLSAALERVSPRFPPASRLDQAQAVLSYQYGTEVAKAMMSLPTRLTLRRGTEILVSEGEEVARRNPFTGLFIPRRRGAMVLNRFSAYLVDLDFEPKDKVVYCPGVSQADPSIRPGDEVIVKAGGEVIGQGRSVLSGREMERSERGKAVVLREIYP